MDAAPLDLRQLYETVAELTRRVARLEADKQRGEDDFASFARDVAAEVPR